MTAAVTRSATTTAKASRPPSNSGDQSRGMNAKAATTAPRAAKPPIVSPADGRTLMRVEQQGQRRSHQQLGGPAERSQVGQCRRDEHAADEGTHDPEADGDDEGPPRPGQQHGDGDRPDDVPLLLDGQRPEVGDRRRCSPQGVVATGGVDPPVLDVEQCGQEIAAQGGCAGQPLERHEGDDHGDAGQRGRQEPSKPASPEGHAVDPAGAVVLDQHERGDQVAGEHEERAHAEPATLGPADREVIEEDCGDGEGAQAVEGRPVGQAWRMGHCHQPVTSKRKYAWPFDRVARFRPGMVAALAVGVQAAGLRFEATGAPWPAG